MSADNTAKKNLSDTVKKEKVTKWLVRINIVAVCVLLCLLILMIYDKTHNRKISSESANSQNEDTVETKLNDSMSSLYESMLAGWAYKIDNKTSFSFGKDGSFSGFFDKDNKDVKGYTYEISIDEETGSHMLNIYNKKKSGMVSYEISMDPDGNILLTYPGADSSFVLETAKAEIISK